MNGDNFDKELADLYQQRKTHIVTPNIDFNKVDKKGRFSMVKLLSIFFVAGCASFGIMAIVSHFSTMPTTKNTVVHTVHITDRVDLTSTEIDEKTILTNKPLPPKPAVNSPSAHVRLEPKNENVAAQVQIDIIDEVIVQDISLPELSQPISKLKPIYKVLPKYAHADAQQGEVDLSYRVDNLGQVIQIKVLESNVNRNLERSAKKALSKWRYSDDTNVEHELRVRFKFSPAES